MTSSLSSCCKGISFCSNFLFLLPLSTICTQSSLQQVYRYMTHPTLLYKKKGYLDWYHYNSQKLEIYQYNSRIRRCTIIIQHFNEECHCLRLLAAWVHYQAYTYRTLFLWTFLPLCQLGKEEQHVPWPKLSLSPYSFLSFCLSLSPPPDAATAAKP